MTIDELIERIQETVRLEDNTVLILRLDRECDPYSFFRDVKGLRELLKSRYKNIELLVLFEGINIESLSKEEMAKAGWYRKEDIMGGKNE
jgi:hypothetical protein